MAGEDISKLPRWAQHRIKKLEADVAHYDKDAKNYCGAVSSRIEVDPSRQYFGDDADRRLFIPDQCRIRFAMAKGYFELSIDGDAIQVYASCDGATEVAVYPQASNTFLVKLNDAG